MLRYSISHRVSRNGGYIPGHHREIDALNEPRGLLQEMGLRRGHTDEEWREPAAELVCQRECDDYRLGGG